MDFLSKDGYGIAKLVPSLPSLGMPSSLSCFDCSTSTKKAHLDI